MGHNSSTNRFRQARLGVDAQAAVDEYKARSVWGAWWSLDDKVRRRYFTREERSFVTRYGARLDEIASHRVEPRTEREKHFLRVCIGEEEPDSPGERLWLLVQVVCRHQRAIERAACADLVQHDAIALRGENKALKARCDHLERYALELYRKVERFEERQPRPLCNVVSMSLRFKMEACGPGPIRFAVRPGARPVGVLTAAGFTSGLSA